MQMSHNKAWEVTCLLMRNKLVLLVLFIPAWIASIHIVSIIDTDHIKKGEQPPRSGLFRVALFNTSDDSFVLVSFKEAGECSHKGSCYLLPGKEHGRVETGEFGYWAYDVVEKTETHLVIQTTANDDDNTIWSTYSTDDNNAITPMKMKMFYFGYMFPAAGMALIFIVLIYISSFIIQPFLEKKAPR
jgi:hypothetical protein